MLEVAGQIVTPTGVVSGVLESIDGIIVGMRQTADAPPHWVLPGVLDWHNHGGGGGDVMVGESGIRQLAKTHARYGMTGFLATTVTAPRAEISAVLAAAQLVMADRQPDEARCFGVHLEGPYLSPAKLGAQPPETRPFDSEEFQEWLQYGVIRVVTCAPEQDPDGQLLAACRAQGIRVQLGHTGCAYQRAKDWLVAGAGITHLFNAMSGVTHRDPGVALAALNHADFAEIICDGVHVAFPALELAVREVPNLYAVTDATAAAGMPDGPYRLGSHEVIKQGNAVRLACGTLAGSAATATTSLLTLQQLGLSMPEIAQMLSTRPAEWLGLSGYGRLEVGCAMDCVVCTGSEVIAVIIAGQSLIDQTRNI